jgi:hypothetical protein
MSKYPTILEFVNLSTIGMAMEDTLRQPILRQWLKPMPCPDCGQKVSYFEAAGMVPHTTSIRAYRQAPKPLKHFCPKCAGELQWEQVDKRDQPLTWRWAHCKKVVF